MEKKHARIGENVINETTINEIEDTFFPTVVGIDPGRVHMAAVVVEKYDHPEQEEPTESLNFFVEQPFYAHMAKQNIHRFRGQKLKGTNLNRWSPLSNKRRKNVLQQCEEAGIPYPYSKTQTRRRKAAKRKAKEKAQVGND